MKLFVDAREKVLSSLLDIEHDKINLDLGDAIIADDDNHPLVIFERKTIADLAASIVDGRYKEQSFRLQSHPIDNHNIIYIIEGVLNPTKRYGAISYAAILSSMCSLSYFKGFSVIRTQNTLETASMVETFFNKIGFNKPIIQKNYSEVVKTTKKSNITKSNISEIMLMQVPGVSPAVAQVIMQHYKDIYQLIVCLKENPECLNPITFVTSASQTKHISKKSIANIKEFLL